MRFFTIDWWRGDIHTDPFPAYRSHFDDIRNQLPEAAIRLHHNVSLHDGWVRLLLVNLAARSVRIEIDADDGRGGLRRIALVYSEVLELCSIAEHEKGLPGPKGYGDLGYDEFDIVDGHVVHRMLFSGNIEIEIRFVSLSLTCTDISADGLSAS